VLETPVQDYASEPVTPRRGAVTPRRTLRRDLSEDFADDFEDDDAPTRRRQGGTRIRFRGLPRTKGGRIAAVVAVLFLLGFCFAAVMLARDLLMHDDRFVIQSSSSIEIEGNSHLTRTQLLSIFGGDVERNIFTVSLADRRAELEQLPWVEHATVMRLLPNRMRVSITERTPVAFVRQGNHIGLVDGNGVLLDMPTDAPATTHYSFPVVTGIGVDEPLSTRAARMKIFERFTSELDADGEIISQKLSEVDLSNPEDVRALIPDHASDVLVHFGEDNFLDRYKKYEAHLAEWRAQYPRLSAVDMRYERQVVLETGPVTPAAASPAAASFTEPSADAPVAAPVVKPPVVKAPVKAKGLAHGTHPVGTKNSAGAKASTKKNDVASWVHPKSGTKHVASTEPQFHPPQVVKP
jgi:cell division protein FtsQ